MAERYLELPFDDRREVLDVAASASGRPAYLLEKDIWVVWSLETLFAGSLGAPLVFKGGTSLSKMGVRCDAADHAPGVEFPTAKPQVLQAERTFWEKATAAHVYCVQRRGRGDGFARHWHDLVRLDDVGIVASASADGRIAEEVAAHKAAFFREKDASGNWVDYGSAVAGGLRLVPAGGALSALADDYARMVEGGWLLDEAEPFGVLMDACRAIEDRANGRTGTTSATALRRR